MSFPRQLCIKPIENHPRKKNFVAYLVNFTSSPIHTQETRMPNIRILVSGVLLCAGLALSAQTPISGVINNYYEVTGIDKCNNAVTLTATPIGLAVGDNVMLIQMRGADTDADNDNTYGSILNYAKCGNYELFTVQAIAFNVVTLNEVVNKLYTMSGKVQLVRIPEYDNVEVVGTVTGLPWNGTIGGIVALIANGTLTFSADIDATGIGFRGAATVVNTPCLTGSPTGFDGYVSTIMEDKAGKKGEGIAADGDDRYARGASANGGGGGNDRQTGGGGGSSYAPGGAGGELMYPPAGSCGGTYPGIGGYPLIFDNAENRIFLGGGGGSGSSNLGTGVPGGNGGGIVLIVANTIDGNNFSVKSNGTNVTAVSMDDGAGGGGGAGVVLLDVANFASNLTVQVHGGSGGNVDNTFDGVNCVGPGGGGSGGVLWMPSGAVPGSVTLDAIGGPSGVTVGEAAISPCFNSPNNATDGSDGGFVGSLALPYATEPYIPLTLDMVPDDAVVCQGNELFMSAVATGTGNPGYLWNDPDASTTPDVFTIPENDFTYTVVVTDDLGCQLIGEVVVDVIDSVEITAFPDTTLELGNSLTLYSNLDDTYTYVWTPAYNIDDPTAANPVVTPYETTMYCVTATHPTGCTSTDCITIIVAAGVAFPNAFTPNGDFVNDVFRIPPVANLCEDITYFKVFNRWGQIVYDYFADPTVEGWDGTLNGKPQEIGTYIYLVQMTCDGEPRTYSGPVHLLR